MKGYSTVAHHPFTFPSSYSRFWIYRFQKFSIFLLPIYKKPAKCRYSERIFLGFSSFIWRPFFESCRYSEENRYSRCRYIQNLLYRYSIIDLACRPRWRQPKQATTAALGTGDLPRETVQDLGVHLPVRERLNVREGFSWGKSLAVNLPQVQYSTVRQAVRPKSPNGCN